MTIEEVKKWLNRAFVIDVLNKLDGERIKELEQLQSAVGGIESKEKVQTSPLLEARYEKIVQEKIELSVKLNNNIIKREQVKIEIESEIDKLDDSVAKAVLKCRYVKLMKFKEIALVVNYGVTQCHRLHDEGINLILEKMEKMEKMEQDFVI